MIVKNSLLLLALLAVVLPTALSGAEYAINTASAKDAVYNLESLQIRSTKERIQVQFVPVLPDKNSNIAVTAGIFPDKGGMIPILTHKGISLRQNGLVDVVNSSVTMSGGSSSRQSYNVAMALGMPKTEPQEMEGFEPPNVKLTQLPSRIFAGAILKKNRLLHLDTTGLAMVTIDVRGQKIPAILDTTALPGVQVGAVVEVELSEWLISSPDDDCFFYRQNYVIGVVWVKGLTLAPVSGRVPKIPYKQALYSYPVGLTGPVR